MMCFNLERKIELPVIRAFSINSINFNEFFSSYISASLSINIVQAYGFLSLRKVEYLRLNTFYKFYGLIFLGIFRGLKKLNHKIYKNLNVFFAVKF